MPINKRERTKSSVERRRPLMEMKAAALPVSQGATVVDEQCSAFPAEYRAILGRRPLLPGDSPVHYDGLVCSLAEAYRPRNFVEWFYIWQTATATWDLMRLRGATTHMLDAMMETVLAEDFTKLRLGANTKCEPNDGDFASARAILASARGRRNPAFDAADPSPRIAAALAETHRRCLASLEALDDLADGAHKRLEAARKSLIEMEFLSQKTRLFSVLHAADAPAEIEANAVEIKQSDDGAVTL